MVSQQSSQQYWLHDQSTNWYVERETQKREQTMLAMLTRLYRLYYAKLQKCDAAGWNIWYVQNYTHIYIYTPIQYWSKSL